MSLTVWSKDHKVTKQYLKKRTDQRSIFSILCFVLISFAIDSVSAQRCTDSGYVFQTDRYLRKLPSHSLLSSFQEGFLFNGSSGQEINHIYAIRMCLTKSTSNSKEYSDCIKISFDVLLTKQKLILASDPTLCFVHYSNTSLLGSADLASTYTVLMQCTPDLSPGTTSHDVVRRKESLLCGKAAFLDFSYYYGGFSFSPPPLPPPPPPPPRQ
ncbi:hypothetical protein HID58_047660 [Brassica napus]|uniref:Uncharacterized protein n=1 Tax=Brassica napus TaxID=3708 RepID=A0ABQ8B004_BRANA|nr:hypothetical protein HID58_047660 [Brassica napus]